MNLLHAKSGALLLGIAFGAAGCGSPYSDYCIAKIDCVRGSDADIEACEVDRERDEEIAAIYGCDAEWEDYYLCYEDRGFCERDNDGNYHYVHRGECDGRYDDWRNCNDYYRYYYY